MQQRDTKSLCQRWDSNPRPHTRTRILRTCWSSAMTTLESGALDRSATLTHQDVDVDANPNATTPRNRTQTKLPLKPNPGHLVTMPPCVQTRILGQSLPACLSAPLPIDHLPLVQSASLSVNNVLVVAGLLALDTTKQQIVCPHSSVARALVS